MTAIDLRTLLFVYGGMHGRWAPAMIAFTILGAGWAALALVPLVWHVRTRPFGLVLGLAIALQAILVVSIKAAVGRVRPWIALGLPAPIGEPRDGSFPSGHAAASFCVAVFLVLAFRSTTAPPVDVSSGVPSDVSPRAVWPGSAVVHRVGAAVALCVAALIALSRVYLGAHFPSDVLGGALLGALVGALGAAVYTGRLRPPGLRGPLESHAKRR